MNHFASLLLLVLVSLSLAQECQKSSCPPRTRCVEGMASSFVCQDGICPSFHCEVDPGISDPCINANCLSSEICLPEPKECVTTPCPQFKCLKVSDFVCATASCPASTKCVVSPKQCFTTPCPQFDCVSEGETCDAQCTNNQICVSEPKQCFTTPCPQFACLEKTECPEMCTREVNPVCGSDDQTYSNECALRMAMCSVKKALYVQYRGECNSKESGCPNICTADYDPVCGTNGNTYGNECALRAAACELKTEIGIASRGECTVCNNICTLEYAPVCGSNGRTYSNLCSLKADACRTKAAITVKNAGECETPLNECPQFCPMIYTPLCASNGKTYGNRCMLEVEVCKTKTSLTVSHEGTCEEQCDTMCTEEYAPVCGGNGITYSNLCFLNSARCLSKNSFELIHNGECFKSWDSISTLDLNGNGEISEGELASSSFYDKNEDGVVNEEDFVSKTQSALSNSRKAVAGVAVAVAFIVGIIVVVVGFLFYKKHAKVSSAQNRAAERTNRDVDGGNYERFNDSL